MHIEYVKTIDSTNSELMRRAAQGDVQSLCLVAQAQTAGRGRLGRSWLSNEHALTFSLGLPLAAKDWSGLSLLVGLCIAEQLHERIQIKWPNDLWVDGGKLAGILIETTALPAHSTLVHRADPTWLHRYCVIGVGINLEPPEQSGSFKTPPAGLRSLLPQITPAETLDRILEPLVSAVQDFSKFGFAPYLDRFTRRDALRRKQIQLASPDSTEALQGDYAGINTQGGLILKTPAGLQTFISHEVSVCF